MAIFRNVVFIAAAAGLVAGVLLAAMQSFATVPLVLQAETFETGGGGHDHSHDGAAAHEHATADGDAAAANGHHHDEDAWAPADGFERFAFNVLANVVTGFGFALVLAAVSELAGGIRGWRQGLIWGFAGFAVFTLAPGLGLPSRDAAGDPIGVVRRPEPPPLCGRAPGTALKSRQIREQCRPATQGARRNP